MNYVKFALHFRFSLYNVENLFFLPSLLTPKNRHFDPSEKSCQVVSANFFEKFFFYYMPKDSARHTASVCPPSKKTVLILNCQKRVPTDTSQRTDRQVDELGRMNRTPQGVSRYYLKVSTLGKSAKAMKKRCETSSSRKHEPVVSLLER